MIKQYLLPLLIVFLLFSCTKNDYSRRSDLSNIKFDIEIKRFDKDFWAIKNTENQREALDSLLLAYREFAPIYFGRIVNFGANIDEVLEILPKFFGDSSAMALYSDELRTFENIENIEKKLTIAFKRAKYFFPQIATPQCIMYVSGLNQNVSVGEGFVAVSADNYLGSDYHIYKSLPNLPDYFLESMKPDRVAPDYVLAWLYSEFPIENRGNNKLIDEIIYKGKIYYLLWLLTEENPNLLIGYTHNQWQWCKENEKTMWKSLIESRNLFTNENSIIIKYIEESPFTLPFSQDSPGRAGVYIGWQIINSYMANNPKVSPSELLNNHNSQMIIEKSGYNPQ